MYVVNCEISTLTLTRQRLSRNDLGKLNARPYRSFQQIYMRKYTISPSLPNRKQIVSPVSFTYYPGHRNRKTSDKNIELCSHYSKIGTRLIFFFIFLFLNRRNAAKVTFVLARRVINLYGLTDNMDIIGARENYL